MSDAPLFADVTLEVSDFIALVNQTFEYAYSQVTIRGELANFRVSKNRWVYFDLRDDTAIVRFFGTVYQLNGPLEDGMLLRVRGTPRLHPLYGFSVTVTNIQPEGEGTILRAAQLLQAKLASEGLFVPERKRPLPYPPTSIGLITSTESAAYADFTKILNARWRGLTIECVDVQVQGEAAPEQIAAALEYFNEQAAPPEVVVIIRGGGSAEDLFTFSTEQVTRAVVASRVPTLVAIGHEVDVSLAELAADQRASTPSNAAELLVPDRKDAERQVGQLSTTLQEAALLPFRSQQRRLAAYQSDMQHAAELIITQTQGQVAAATQLLRALDPRAVMQRGYAIVRNADGRLVRRRSDVRLGDIVNIEVSDGGITATTQ